MVDTRKVPAAEAIIEPSEWRWVFIASAMFVVLIALPFTFAYAAAGPGYQFQGVLVNPIDGMSYLARMYQGYTGSWLSYLPYTPEPHRGVAIYTFYLALGHIARIFGVPLILVMHAARLTGSLLMLVTLYVFAADWTASIQQRRVTWGLMVVASGLGWLFLLTGRSTPLPDLLILPEAFPLQAAYANAHFPWALASAIYIAHALVSAAVIETERWPVLDAHTIGLAAAAIMTVSITPFVLAPIAVGYGALCILLWVRRRAFPRREVTWGGVVLVFGLPVVAYSLWAVSGANPEFHEWMSQNQTPSPPVGDYLAAFGPLLILAGIGLWGARRFLQPEHIFLMGWIVATAVLVYSPIALQRRFATGITIPLAVFAGIGLWRVIFPLVSERWHETLLLLVLSLTAPTTVMALAIPLFGARNPGEAVYYYVSDAEIDAFSWLQSHASPRDALVLASPDTSLFLPVRGLRVVYGHPYETLRGGERKLEVTDFYQGLDCSVVGREQVQYVFVGPRERRLADGKEMCPPPGNEVYKSADGEVMIYATSGQ